MKRRWVKTAFRWAFLAAYVGACVLILVESAIDGDGSSKQSNVITAQVEAIFNRNYDRREVKELRDFNVVFDKDPSTNVFHAGDVLNYSCSFSPSDASDPTLKWTITQGDDVISIDEANQQITFLSYGSAELNVSCIKKPELRKIYTLVSEKITVQSIKAEKEINLIAGDSNVYPLQATVLPKNADEEGLKFVSSNPDVVQVDETDGSVKACKEGEAIITITSVDDPSISTSVHVTASSSEKIDLKLRSIALNTEEVVLNENVPSALVEGSYGDLGTDFDPSKIKVDLGEFSNLVTVSEKKITSLGNFSFRLSLNDQSVAEKEGFADLLGKIKVIYEDLPKSEMSLSLAIKRLKTITADVIDYSQVQLDINCHYIHLKSMDGRYIEPINISIPFKKGFRPSDYKQDGQFVADDSRVIASSNSYSSFQAAPQTEIEGLSANVTYEVGGVDLLTFHCSYSEIEDDSCTHFELGLSKFVETEMEFLVGEVYDDSDQERLFETYVSSDSTNPIVSEALKSASLSFSSSDSNILNITTDTLGLSSLKFLKPGEAKLTVSFLSKSKEYSLKGVDSPNDYALKLDGESFSDDGLRLSKGETKIVSAEGLVSTSLKEGKISRPLACSVKGGIPSSCDASISLKTGASNAYFAIKGVEECDSIPLTIELYDGKSFSQTLTKDVSVKYVPVSSFKLSMVLSKSPDEYNSPNDECSIVPLGTILKGQVSTNEDATNQRATYSSNQESVLKVNPSTGLVETVGVGEAEIKAVSQDDLTKSSIMKIKVIDSVSPFDLDLTKMGVPSSSISEDGSYRICLNYGDSYRLRLNTKAFCSTSALTCRYAGSSANHLVRVDGSGLVSSLGVGEETVEIGYENELTSYFVEVTFEVKRNLGFTLEQLSLVVRKTIGHYSLFAVTALLSLGFIFLTFSKPAHQYMALGVSSLIGFGLATLSEFIQLFTSGRYGAWSDVDIDTAGYMTSILIAALTLGIILLVRAFHKKKKKDEKENAK